MAIDGIGWDWSYVANEEDHALVADGETPTEVALMANIENNVFNNSLCSKDCKKNTDSLNSKINELKNELYESNTYRHSYKLGVDQLEGKLGEYKEREVKYIEKIRTLEMYKESNLERIKILTNEVETLEEEKDVVDGKLACLLKSSKDLENIIESQRSEKVKEGVGYNAVPPPAADLYLFPKKDLAWTGLPKFVDDTVTDYSRPSPTVATNIYRHSYKLGIDQLEGRLAEYKEREVKYIEIIRTLEMNNEYNLEKIKKLTSEVETLKEEKDVVDGKLARLLKSSKYLENIIESQRSEKVKEGVGYNAVPPPAADLYLSPKKDLSWTGLPEFVDDSVTDYSRPSPTVASTSLEDQNKDTSTSEEVASTNPSKPFVKFVKPKDSQPESKLKEQEHLRNHKPSPTVASTSSEDQNKDTSTSEEVASTKPSKPFVKFVKPKDSQPESKLKEQETPKKPQVKYFEQNRQSNKRPKGNQRNWNNLKSYQLGPEFVLHKKPCFNCGDFSHLAKDCSRRHPEKHKHI
uniref:Ubiquitin hydrolase n=1 Tax=Tanacetum cinerariifolium TaxID=118510 RepID=A0A699L244_TANCI|nr:ubiquitin hydrolase [Tanacetum cinerariifolium]